MRQFQCVPTTYDFPIKEFFAMRLLANFQEITVFNEMSIYNLTSFHVACHAPG